jgi:ABC-2 type transport system permease protein
VKDLRFVLLAAVAVGVAIRVWRRWARTEPGRVRRPVGLSGLGRFFGDTGLVAAREIRERLRSRIFRVVTFLILGVVAAAIVIPVVTRGKGSSDKIGVVGTLPVSVRSAIGEVGVRLGTPIRFVTETTTARARSDVRSGVVDLAVIDRRQIVVDKPINADKTADVSLLAQELSQLLGSERAYAAAGLSPTQAAELAHPASVPITSLQRASTGGTKRTTSVIGLILEFVMLSQYGTWTLIGVMEEKASRVVEVLLATVRPIQLLGGKVLGIGLVALGQASLAVGFALVLGKAVGSDLLHGTAPLVLVASLVWLILGYAFYCWVYAAAGSMAERQDQIQALALPLSIPMIFAYIVSLTAATGGNASLLVKVLAYLPPTAPFAMPVLVGLGQTTWWGFAASAVITLLGTAAVAQLASGVYGRAVLRTGRRVRLAELRA